MQDSRNVMDDLKGMRHSDIMNILDKRGVELEIAIENIERDFSMGTIVRNANAFGVRSLHVIGRKQWNKRGAMMTDKYLNIHYHQSVAEFAEAVEGKHLVAVDIVQGAEPLQKVDLPKDSIMIFGAEGPGLSGEMLDIADKVVMIEQLGSTRSINVGVASGIAMYDWLRRYRL